MIQELAGTLPQRTQGQLEVGRVLVAVLEEDATPTPRDTNLARAGETGMQARLSHHLVKPKLRCAKLLPPFIFKNGGVYPKIHGCAFFSTALQDQVCQIKIKESGKKRYTSPRSLMDSQSTLIYPKENPATPKVNLVLGI